MSVCLTDNEIIQIGKLVTHSNSPEFPQILLQFVRILFPVDNIVTLGFSPKTPPIELFRDFPHKAGYEFSRLYHQGAYLLDPFYQISLDKQKQGVFTMKGAAPDRFFHSEYYSSYFCKLPLIDELCLLYPLSSEWSLAYSLARGPQLGPYTSKEISSLKRIEPVLGPLIVKQWGESILNKGQTAPLRDVNETARRIFTFAKSESSKGISPRESEVAALILRGHSSYSISETLGIAVSTVKVLRRRLYRKLNISSQNELYMKLFPAVFNQEN